MLNCSVPVVPPFLISHPVAVAILSCQLSTVQKLIEFVPRRRQWNYCKNSHDTQPVRKGNGRANVAGASVIYSGKIGKKQKKTANEPQRGSAASATAAKRKFSSLCTRWDLGTAHAYQPMPESRVQPRWHRSIFFFFFSFAASNLTFFFLLGQVCFYFKLFFGADCGSQKKC